MKTKHIIYCIFGVLMFAACSGIDYEQQLERFEEMNRTDVPLCVDSVQPLVHHYDHWWHSRNHRMRAYYMLGCAYRDQGEAPAAIHYYNIAAEQADTTSKNCDYATLFRVYGQMAFIYGQQNLPKEHLRVCINYSKYALLAKDTINHLLGLEHTIVSYYNMDDSLQVIRTTDKVRKLYLQHGLRENAARVYPTAIYVSLLNGNYTRARRYMDLFERESKLFDGDGNIAQGREQYYYSKGLYYKGTGKLDSAEHYFRRLLPYGYELEANEGLFSIYEETRNIDSIVKYAHRHEQSLMQWRASRQAEAIIQSSAMYDYNRIQNVADRKAKDAHISHILVGLLLMTLVVLSLLVHIIYNHYQKREIKKELAYRRLVEEHMETRMRFQQQDKLMQTYRNEVAEKEESLKNEKVYNVFKDYVNNPQHKNKPTRKERDKLIHLYSKYMPHIHARMELAKLTTRELLVSILTHLGFQAGEICILMETTSNIISNTKLSANRKLFSDKTATTLQKNLKKCAYFE